MCLINERPPEAQEYIGYAVVVKAYGGPHCDKTYDSVFYPRLLHINYGIGKKCSACSSHPYARSSYYGFHGFHTLADAQWFHASLPVARSGILCIVKAKFEEVLADGDYIDEPLKLRSFRSKYRTILKEVGN